MTLAMKFMKSRHAVSAVLVAMGLAACHTMPTQTAAIGDSGTRAPASSDDRAPNLKNTQWRVVQNMNLKPLKFGGRTAVYISDGRVLSEAQVKDLRESATPQITQYCALYASERLQLSAGEVLTIGVAMPQGAHWEPGHVYVIQSAQHKGIQGFGCFALSEEGRQQITEKEIREHLRGIVEEVR